MSRPPRSRWQRILRRAALALGLVLAFSLVCASLGLVWLRFRLTASLPILDGSARLPGAGASVTVERDALGVPRIRASSRIDLARATGLLHAQDRFFQMDLARRNAAGELAALFGESLVATDRARRVHRFRAISRAALETLAAEERELLAAYAQGVNAGLAALGGPPPEYLALRSEPVPWLAEDTLLVARSMYLELQSDAGRRETELALMRALLPAGLVEFLTPSGTSWDAPIAGEPARPLPLPPPEVYDLRGRPQIELARTLRPGVRDPVIAPGSNAWAVAGSHTASGAALLANDLHLDLGLPNQWYRVSLEWPAERPGELHRVVGVTLPGAPPIVVGSNGRIAWGFTNSYGDFSDLVPLERDEEVGGDEEIYRTPDGPRRVEHFRESIEVRGGRERGIDVPWTIWGPIVGRDRAGRRQALSWVAHDVRAANLGLVRLERAVSVDEALALAPEIGVPTQNLVVADREGHIGWTLIGPIPQRIGFDGSVPVSRASGEARSDGFLDPARYPSLEDPPGGRIWSANHRTLGGEALALLGDGGFALGARAAQIRDDLHAIDRATEADLLGVQLDDRAIFLERWRTLLLDALDPAALAANERRRELRTLAERGWTGRASIDSTGYRIVREFRATLAEAVLGAIAAPCREADPHFDLRHFPQWEAPLWSLVTERPVHLLDPRFRTWDEQLLAAVDATIARLSDEDGALGSPTWGETNLVAIRHPLSRFLPSFARRWLDLPPEKVPGDIYMPRVQGPSFGASLRLVVTPGREESAIFELPGGQSGHPLSPFYRAGHEHWVRGEAAPLLPGPVVHTLTLHP